MSASKLILGIVAAVGISGPASALPLNIIDFDNPASVNRTEVTGGNFSLYANRGPSIARLSPVQSAGVTGLNEATGDGLFTNSQNYIDFSGDPATYSIGSTATNVVSTPALSSINYIPAGIGAAGANGSSEFLLAFSPNETGSGRTLDLINFEIGVQRGTSQQDFQYTPVFTTFGNNYDATSPWLQTDVGSFIGGNAVDLFVYVPISAFAGLGFDITDELVIRYELGQENGGGDGWALVNDVACPNNTVCDPPPPLVPLTPDDLAVPLPPAAFLMLTAFGLMGFTARRRARA